MLLDTINESKAQGQPMGLPPGGYWVYDIQVYFDDGETDDFPFFNRQTHVQNGVSVMERISGEGGSSGAFSGLLVNVFHELSVKYSPSEANMEWYETVLQKKR